VNRPSSTRNLPLVDFRGQGDDAVIAEDDVSGLGVAGWLSVALITAGVALLAWVSLTSSDDPPNRPVLSQEHVVIVERAKLGDETVGHARLPASPALARED